MTSACEHSINLSTKRYTYNSLNFSWSVLHLVFTNLFKISFQCTYKIILLNEIVLKMRFLEKGVAIIQNYSLFV